MEDGKAAMRAVQRAKSKVAKMVELMVLKSVE